MYFASRTAAGKLLAEQVVARYKGQPCAVIALSDGSVMVGAQIALKLQSLLCLLMMQAIELPREIQPVGGITEDGSFTYNDLYSPSEIEELVSEYHNYLNEERGSRLSGMHRLLGSGGSIRKELLTDKNIILVSDGLSSGFSLDMAAEFLKTVKYKRLVVATPLASVPAVDRMHVLADEIFCLTVVEDYINTDHYYDARDDVPPHDKIVKVMEEIMQHWK